MLSCSTKAKGWGLGLTLLLFAPLLPAQQPEVLPFLTAEQWAALEANNESYRNWVQQTHFERMNIVNFELYEERRRPVLDPLALGLRLAEFTAIRRLISTRITEISAANQKLLTPAQQARINALVINEKLTALSYAAPCEYWFTTPPTTERPISVYDIIYAFHRNPDCAKLTLADYLELSPATRADFNARREQLFQTFDQLLLDYKKHLAAYETALVATPLDPLELGRSYAGILQVFRDYGDARTAFINRRYADLTPAQQAKIKAVNDAVLDISNVLTADCYGLLLQPAPIIPNDQPTQGFYYGSAAYSASGYWQRCLTPPEIW